MRKIIGVASTEGRIKEKVAEIREDAVKNMEEYIQSFSEKIEENGAQVHRAKHADEAKKILKGIVGDKSVIKSKTNVGKELRIFRAVETDTGDFIAKMLGDSGHPILPALGITVEEIAGALEKKYGVKASSEPASVISAIREILREKIVTAELGITGANVLTADGEIFIVESEGNVALTSHLPETHIVITSLEKVVKDSFYAMLICRALALFGTGQRTTSYVNIISGPSKTADVGGKIISPAQGPKELHIILLDNGRSELLNSPYNGILKCINCGACVSVCPISHILGRRYGFEHCGTRGLILQRYQKHLERIFEKGWYCTGCAICREVCPAGVDLPELTRQLRAELHRGGLQTKNNKKMVENVLEGGDSFGDKGSDPDTRFYCC